LITIIDYGAGNIGSVYKAFKYLGEDIKITNDKQDILAAKALILPGVGAFEDAMNNLNSKEMVQTIKEFIKTGKPFLAICLGLQVLFDGSEEGNPIDGFKLFEGTIKRIPANLGLKVPHIGWNKLEITNGCPMYKDFNEEIFVYFVHSYYLKAKDQKIVSGRTRYGIEIDASIYSDNVYATQFHPEKSGKTGLKMLKNFIETR